MRAGVVVAPGRLEVQTLPRPQTPEGGLLLRVVACGICGTDLRIFRHGDPRVPFPQVLGHEIVGTVQEVGPGAAGFAHGDLVVVAPPKAPCGACRFCHRGETNLCPHGHSFGYQLPGGLAEYVAVPPGALRAGVVHRVRGEAAPHVLAFTEPVACCLRGQRKVGLGAGDRVVVIGAGPAGSLHIRLARLAGASLIVVSERRAARRSHVRPWADRVVDPQEEDLAQVVQGLTDGQGADVVITACSSADAQVQALTLVGRGGRINLFGGLPRGAPPLPLDANLVHYQELTITGTHGSTPAENAEALALLASGRLAVDDLVTHRLPLEEVERAFGAAQDLGAMKAVVCP